MANTFATHFCSVYSRQVSNAPSPHQTCDGALDTATIIPQEVHNKLRALNPTSSMGSDDVHPNLLTSCPVIALPTNIPNISSFSPREI